MKLRAAGSVVMERVAVQTRAIHAIVDDGNNPAGSVGRTTSTRATIGTANDIIVITNYYSNNNTTTTAAGVKG
jgi:hypothetical protein